MKKIGAVTISSGGGSRSGETGPEPVAAPAPARPVAALGIDIGSSNTKVAIVVVDDGGAVRELMVRSVPTPDDAVELLGRLAALSRTLLALTRVTPQAVGIASMAETGVPLDAAGEPLSPLIRWNSRRDPADAERIAGMAGRAELFEATGVRAGPKAPLAVWAGLRRSEPELFGAMSRWAGVSDLVALDLTGERGSTGGLVTDHTLAARTMAYRLPGLGDPLPEAFDPELLALAGMRPEQLPRIAAPGEPAGRVSADAAARTGLPAGIPVIVAGHDHAVGAWGAGVREPGRVADSVGTSEALVRILAGSADRRAVAASGMSLGRDVTGRFEVLLAGSANGGALVRWWSERFPGTDLPGLLDAADAAADSAAAAAGAGILLLPYLAGRQTPLPDPHARLRVLDGDGRELPLESIAPADAARALLQGLALHLRWMHVEQRRLAGPSGEGDEPITVLGASAASSWLRTKAAIMPSRLQTVAVSEPVASAAALLAAVRTGIASDATRLPVRAVPPGAGAVFDRVFDRFVAAAAAAVPVAESSADPGEGGS